MNLQIVMSMFHRVPSVIAPFPIEKMTVRTTRKDDRRKVVLSLLAKHGYTKQTIFCKICESIGEQSTIRKDIQAMVKVGLILSDTRIHNHHFLEVAP